MVFIKVKPCSTRPTFPPAVASLLPVALFFPLPVPLLPILAPCSSSFFFSFFSFLLALLFRGVRHGGEGVGEISARGSEETVETPLARKNEKGRTRSRFDVINLGMAVTRSDGRGSSLRTGIDGSRVPTPWLPEFILHGRAIFAYVPLADD